MRALRHYLKMTKTSRPYCSFYQPYWLLIQFRLFNFSGLFFNFQRREKLMIAQLAKIRSTIGKTCQLPFLSNSHYAISLFQIYGVISGQVSATYSLSLEEKIISKTGDKAEKYLYLMHVCNKDLFTFFKMDPIKLSISDYVNILQQNVRKQEYTKHFDGYLHNTTSQN